MDSALRRNVLNPAPSADAIYKPELVIRPHLLRFVITVMLPYCFRPLADICADVSSRRSPLRLR